MTPNATVTKRRRRKFRRRVLLTAGPVYALLDRHDARHTDALTLFERFEDEEANVACAYLAATDVHQLLLTRAQVTAAQAHLLIMKVLSVFPPVVPTLEDVEDARASLRHFHDYNLSLSDATIAATALRKIRMVAAFTPEQRHFELLGTEVYPL